MKDQYVSPSLRVLELNTARSILGASNEGYTGEEGGYDPDSD